MTLFECIKDSISLGYKVYFKIEFNQLEIRVSKSDIKTFQVEELRSHLPLSEVFFYEQKVVDCIQWMRNKISCKIYGHE